MQVDEFTTPDMLDEEVSNILEMNGGNQEQRKSTTDFNHFTEFSRLSTWKLSVMMLLKVLTLIQLPQLSNLTTAPWFSIVQLKPLFSLLLRC